MSRRRNPPQVEPTAPPVSTQPTQESKAMSSIFEILEETDLAQLEQDAKRRGEYAKVLGEFMAAEDADGNPVKAARISTESGPFQGRAVSSVKTGFTNAIEKGKVEGATAETVEVLVAKEKVYLRRRDV